MPTSSAAYWKSLFTAWPQNLPRKGSLTNSFNEQIPFKGFMVNGDVLLLERTIPDASGVRFILMSFADVSSVRFIDPVREADFTAAGFSGHFAGH